ncbi:LuxR family transcriptional regulator [Actinomadura sp. DC4]|uniref:helix-turn-helix transcriptional regulator n=1 Tax=Actinomadura sp. DC4 TaxID=3055069 RepID=UPI0025B020FC|nr:LuxR family transcriptional regulator [Actinomadura sp. DC4]MDN3356392.1 LuxR C-terminal-related transcriptional regulator [Actinomadura sp. DC4]
MASVQSYQPGSYREEHVRAFEWTARSVGIALGSARDEMDEAPPARLTVREREIAGLIAEGLSNGEIAHRLHISERAVKTHVTRILAKLGIVQRAAVAVKLRPPR